MATGLLPLCFQNCARFGGLDPRVGYRCAAYPGGIPVDILASAADHRRPFAGDRGLRYRAMWTDRRWVGDEAPLSCDDEFREEDHPRGELGRFAAGASGTPRHQPAWGKNKIKNATEAARLASSLGHSARVYSNPKSSGAAFYSNGEIHVNAGHKFWSDPIGKMKSARASNAISSEHPEHVIHHEIGHALYEPPNNFMGLNEQDLARSVSKYAAMNPKEFVSEVHAGRQAGIEYPVAVMKLFERYARKREAQDLMLAQDPPTSSAQRRAMFAAAAGHSNLGIPKSVGTEFANSDPGGHLPARAKDMEKGEMSLLRKLMGKFLGEEEREPEHAQDAPKGRAASVAFVAKDGKVLFVKRADDEENFPGHWAFPGGKLDGDEHPMQAAIREAREELGDDCGSFDGMRRIDGRRSPRSGWDHTTFAVPAKDEFEPKLNHEHSAYQWSHVDEAPEPLHPGVRATLEDCMGRMGARDAGTAHDPANGQFTSGQVSAHAHLTKAGHKHVGTVSAPEFSEGEEGISHHYKHPRSENETFVHPSEKSLVQYRAGGKETFHGINLARAQHLASAQDTADPTGRLSATTRREVSSTRTREDMPESAFLLPSQRKYPVKEERDGEYKYTRNLLLAASREARMHGRGDLAKRADAIREREFPSEGEDDWSPEARAAALEARKRNNGHFSSSPGQSTTHASRSEANRHMEYLTKLGHVDHRHTSEVGGEHGGQLRSVYHGHPKRADAIRAREFPSEGEDDWSPEARAAAAAARAARAGHSAGYGGMRGTARSAPAPNTPEGREWHRARNEGEAKRATENAALRRAIKEKYARDQASDMAMDWSGAVALTRSGVGYGVAPPVLAFDRASVRTTDEDGRLHIAEANIAKASVNGYLGKEIPDYEKLGLDPERKYMLLRDPAELKKSVDTFNNLPILSKHQAVTADSFPQDLVVGSTGSDAKWEPPFIKNSLVFWPKKAIDEIESSEKKSLSPAYRYVPVMTSGEHEGVRFDGIMTRISANHLAQVSEGRQGPDVVVGDSAPDRRWRPTRWN